MGTARKMGSTGHGIGFNFTVRNLSRSYKITPEGHKVIV